MIKSKTILIHLALVFLCVPVFSQSKKIDSLKLALTTERSDTQKIKILHGLAWRLKDTEPDKARNYLRGILKITEDPKIPGMPVSFLNRYKANAHLIWGLIETRQGKYAEALAQQNTALEIGKQSKEAGVIADATGNIGIVYYMQGSYPQALEYYLKAFKVAEENADKKRIANLSNNLGGIYIHLADTDKAQQFFTRSLEMNKTLGNRSGMGNNYSNLGLILKNHRHLNEALANFRRSLEIALENGDKEKEAATYDNMANTFFLLGKMDSSLILNLKSEKIYAYIGDQEGLGSVYVNLASTYSELKDNHKAESFLLKAEKIAKQIKSKDLLDDAYKQLSAVYSLLGKDRQALETYKLYITYRDSLSNEENTKRTVRLEMNYEFDKKEAAAKLEQEKKEAVAAAESKKQRIIIISACGILLLVFAFAVFAYRSFLQKKKANEEITKQKHVIEEKQKEILDSIYYARRIQRSLLTNEKYIARNLKKLISKN